MPSNPLTEALKDFRTYRPQGHNDWLSYVEEEAKKANVMNFALEDNISTLHYLENLDQIREFRDRHWRLTMAYIIKYSKHPVATGGTPIITWLPNQLRTVLQVIADMGKKVSFDNLLPEEKEELQLIIMRADAHGKSLDEEIA